MSFGTGCVGYGGEFSSNVVSAAPVFEKFRLLEKLTAEFRPSGINITAAATQSDQYIEMQGELDKQELELKLTKVRNEIETALPASKKRPFEVGAELLEPLADRVVAGLLAQKEGNTGLREFAPHLSIGAVKRLQNVRESVPVGMRKHVLKVLDS